MASNPCNDKQSRYFILRGKNDGPLTCEIETEVSYDYQPWWDRGMGLLIKMPNWKNSQRLWVLRRQDADIFLFFFCLLFMQGFLLKINENIGGKIQVWSVFDTFFSFKGLHCSILFVLFYFVLSMKAVMWLGVQTLPRSNLDKISFFVSTCGFPILNVSTCDIHISVYMKCEENHENHLLWQGEAPN